MLRPCPDCGRPRPGDACSACGWTSRRPDLRTNRHKVRSETARRAHVAAHGLVCPGWAGTGHEPHPVATFSELTFHHTTDDPDGPGVVLCRDENSSIGAPR